MLGSLRAARLTVGALVVSGAIAVASCSGGSVATTPIATPTASSAPQTQTIPSSGGTLSLASSTAQTASIAFASGVAAGTSLTASSSVTAPSIAPAISSLARSAQAKTQATTQAITGAVPFFYVTFSVSANLSSQFISSETVSLLPSNPATATYGAAFDDITTSPGTEIGTAGPGTISGGIVSIINGTSQSAPTLQAGHTYLIQFFYIPAGTATPSPSPSGSSTPSPSPTGTGTSGPTSPPSVTFSGSTDTLSMSPTGVPIPMALGIYRNIAFTNIQWPATTSGSGVMTITDATNTQGDVTGTFTPYTGAGTAIMYLQFSATSTLTFPATPTMTITDTSSFPGTGCAFFGYINNNNTPYAWTQVSANFVPSTGSAPYTVNLPAVTAATVGGTIQFQPSPFYGAIVCQ